MIKLYNPFLFTVTVTRADNRWRKVRYGKVLQFNLLRPLKKCYNFLLCPESTRNIYSRALPAETKKILNSYCPNPKLSL